MKKIFLTALLGVQFQIKADFSKDVQDSRNVVGPAILQAKADIERDLNELNRLRENIAAQRLPLNSRLDELKNSIKEQREKAAYIRGLRTRSGKQREEIENEISAVKEELRFISALFSEYARAMETRSGVAENPAITEQLRSIQQIDDTDESFSNLSLRIDSLLKTAASRAGHKFEGTAFKGNALDTQGIEHTGVFSVSGPSAWFCADDNPAISGLAVIQFGSDTPGVFSRFDQNSIFAIQELTKNGEAVVPMDVTGGDAIKVEDAKPTLIEHLKKGGFVMIPLLIVALTAIAISFWKFIRLSFIRVDTDGLADKVISELIKGDIDAARKIASGIRNPMQSLVNAAIEYRNSPREHMEEIMHEQILSMLPSIEHSLGALAVLGGVAPLLGLLGTVTGMIHTFQLVTIFGSGDAKLLSGGISEALVTTETGLAIAIPILLIHAYLARRARGIGEALECAAVKIVNIIKTQGEGK